MAAIAAAIGPTSQQRLIPYISLDWLKYHQRRGVRYDDLVAGGRPDDNDAAVAGIIEEASGRADSIMQQVLAATMDTVLTTVNINRKGFAAVHPRYRPIIAMTAASMGPAPNMLQAITDLSAVGVQQERFTVPCGPTLLTSSQGPIQFGSISAPMDQAWIQYTYCNGYPVTELTAPVAEGATTIDVADTTGIVAGATWMTIYAGKNRHRFLATAVSTAGPGELGTGPGTVTLSSPAPLKVPSLGPYPTMVSALPADFMTGVALLCRAIVKTTGGGNVTSQTSTGNRKVKDPLGAGDDFATAEEILNPYSAVVV